MRNRVSKIGDYPAGFLATTVEEGAAQLGPELVTNGGFDTDSDWNKNGWWLISGGVASMPLTSTYYGLTQEVDADAGKAYQVDLDVVSLDGEIKMSFADAATPTNEQDLQLINSVGHKTFIIIKSGGNRFLSFARQQGDESSATIDNVSVREVIPTWRYKG